MSSSYFTHMGRSSLTSLSSPFLSSSPEGQGPGEPRGHTVASQKPGPLVPTLAACIFFPVSRGIRFTTSRARTSAWSMLGGQCQEPHLSRLRAQHSWGWGGAETAQDELTHESLREDAVYGRGCGVWETELEPGKGITAASPKGPHARSRCAAHHRTSPRLTRAAPEAVDAGWDSDPQLPASQACSLSCVQVVV